MKIPWSYPIIRRAIMIKPNKFYDFLFYVGYAWNYFGSEMLSVGELYWIAKSNFKKFYKGNHSSSS